MNGIRTDGSARRRLPALAAIAGAIVLAACSANPPELVGVASRLSFAPSSGPAGYVETLSVSVQARDQDGYGDLETLYVMNDAEELVWKIGRDDWHKRDEGNDTWIGATGLAAPAGGALPRGAYRVALLDSSGERTERSFSVGAARFSTPRFPSIALDGSTLTVTSPFAENVVLFVDGEGDTIAGAQAKPGTTSLDSLYGSTEWKTAARSVVLYAYDSSLDIGWYSWPIQIE